jgi:electron transfer flavoprotein beta subunit
MDVIVCLKQTFDTEATVLLTDCGEISDQGVKLIVNPYDEYAIEEALQLVEKHGGTVTAVSVGSDRTESALRAALAMGVDKAILICWEGRTKLDEWVIANALSAAIKTLPYDVILTGRVAVDDGSAQVAARLAESLRVPFVDSISSLSIENGHASAVHEVNGGAAKVTVELPAVFSTQKGLNDPRYPAMAGILMAKKKPLAVWELQDLCADPNLLAPKTQTTGYILPPSRKDGRILSGTSAEVVSELARLLRAEEKVV